MDNFIDTPDEIRPKNPWPRLLMLIGLILLCIFSIGICTVNFLKSGPEPAIQLEASQLEINIPRFEPVTRWGADPNQFTYGVWIVQTQNQTTQAFFSRNILTGCNVQWLPTKKIGDIVGVFRDPCDESIFTINGDPLNISSYRTLDYFEPDITGGLININVSSINIGACTNQQIENVVCSSTTILKRKIPLTGTIEKDFGLR
ncbi:MAG: hypothetical protein MK020_02835 [Dehalococcoidia bacterium]|jgi:homoaconitase/3-isopropylmalate dehydratase large subunit|nr:hypothetical protein [Dehalococcoidia bacterium]|tara:strand:- start:6465 stop:7070 length:606 start_codon:yes stop_codon:yes gene_type:complete